MPILLNADTQDEVRGSVPSGGYLRVRLSGGDLPGIVVPQTAVLQSSKGAFVWFVNGEGRAEQRAVRTAAWVETGWPVYEGLNAGDTVILDNLLRLQPGRAVAVQIVQPPAEADGAREISQRPARAPAERTRGG